MSLRKLKCLSICFSISAIVFLALAISIPFLFEYLLNKMARSNVIMSPENYNLWGKIPGESSMVIERQFFFYNLTNPNEVLFANKTPELIEVGPFHFQEYQEFLQANFSQNNEIVRYFYWVYMKPYNTAKDTANRNVTILNIVPLAVWGQLKSAERPLLALQGLGMLVMQLEDQVMEVGTAQAVQMQYFNEKGKESLLKEIRDLAKREFVWGDSSDGLNSTAFAVAAWIKAARGGVRCKEAKRLRKVFEINLQEMSGIFVKLKEWSDVVERFINNSFCKKEVVCDGKYLFALQWSQQGITKSPPGGAKGQPSITTGNKSAEGYIEISYFYEEYFLKRINKGKEYQNLTFSTEWAMKLLRRNNSTNWIKDWDALLHIGNMRDIFSIGEQFENTKNLTTLEKIKKRFGLESVYHTHVFWKYLEYLVDDFILKTKENGTREILGLGALGSQTFYQKFVEIQDFFYLEIKKKTVRKTLENNNCSDLFKNSIDKLSQISIEKLCKEFGGWQEEKLLFLINICIEEEIQLDFAKNYSITEQQVLQFCFDNKKNSFKNISEGVIKELHDWYNCSNIMKNCGEREFLIKQWSSSEITKRPSPTLKKIFNASESISDWFPNRFPKKFEYSAFSSKSLLNSYSEQMLNFDNFFNPFALSNFFLKKNLSIDLLNYFRYIVLEFALGGFVRTLSVEDILFGYEEPLLQKLKETDPIIGGNPFLSSKLGFSGNMTYDDALAQPQSMFTGKSDYKKIRTYHSIFDNENIVFPFPDFNGNKSQVIYKQPWKVPVKLKGTDTVLNSPNIIKDKVDYVYSYVPQLYRYAQTDRTKDNIDYYGINAIRFKISEKFLLSKKKSPNNEQYFQDKYNGFLNFTGLFGAPIFNSKMHMLECDKEIRESVKMFKDPLKKHEILPDPVNDNLYIDVEPYSGASLSAYLKLQMSYLLSKNELFYGNVTAMIPFLSFTRGGSAPEVFVNKMLGPLKTAITLKKILPIVFYVLFGIFFILAVFFGIKYKKKNDSENKDKLLDGSKDNLMKSTIIE